MVNISLTESKITQWTNLWICLWVSRLGKLRWGRSTLNVGHSIPSSVASDRRKLAELGAFVSFCFLNVEAVWSCCELPRKTVYCSAFPHHGKHPFLELEAGLNPSSFTLLLVLHFLKTESKITNTDASWAQRTRNLKICSDYNTSVDPQVRQQTASHQH